MRRNENDRRDNSSHRFDRRDNSSPRFNSNQRHSNKGRFTPREMHDAVCASCQSTCQVPFKPVDGRPVYCKACFEKNRPERF